MCGIAGFFGLKPDSAPQPLLARMVTTIAHRGPDASGVHVEGDVGLGHARLSIIDIAGGQQPMANDDGSIWITFNGEIFNYLELRRDLIARGHRFTTDSDTEVIIRAYEDMGPDCVTAFNGDFAFALWDKRKGPNDAGARPHGRAAALLHPEERRAAVRIGGEGAAGHAAVDAALDPIALDQIFTFWFPLAPADHLQGHLRAAAGACADRRCERYQDASLLAARLSGRRRRRRRRYAETRARLPRTCANCFSTPCASGCAPMFQSAPISAAVSTRPWSSPP